MNWAWLALQTNDQIRKRGRFIEYGWKFEFSRSVHAWSLHSEVQEGKKSRANSFVPGRVLLSLCHLHSCSCCTVRSLSGFWFVCTGHRWEKEVGIRKNRNYLCVQLWKPFWIGKDCLEEYIPRVHCIIKQSRIIFVLRALLTAWPFRRAVEILLGWHVTLVTYCNLVCISNISVNDYLISKHFIRQRIV